MSEIEADGVEGIANLKLSANGKEAHSTALMETAAGAAAVGVIGVGETAGAAPDACSLASCNLSSLCSL